MNSLTRTSSPITRPLFALGLLALAGCEPPDRTETSLLRSEELPPGDYDDACPLERQIAVKSANLSSCPPAENWHRKRLFAGSGESLLSNYCRYSWIGEDPVTTDDVDLLDAVAGLGQPDSDCNVVFPQSDPLSDAAAPLLRTMFLESLHQPPASTLRLNPGLVEVAVIDTVPEGAITPTSWHGEFMARIIEDVACPVGAACGVDVQRWLGLPRVAAGTKDPINGGFYGSQADLAKAIYDAVEAWQGAGATDRLIINISAAWEPEIYGAAGASAPVDAVVLALEYAWCQGALVVAAAGNEGPACTTGALLPGGLEIHPVPTVARCNQLGATMVAPGPGYRPLVYSVGGLDLANKPMPGMREGGEPRLAALATHVVAGQTDLTVTMTGTSTATAAVTGAAALLWSQEPLLSASEVMDRLYATGNPLKNNADYIGPGTSMMGVREVNICRALNLPCADAAPTVSEADVLAAIASLPVTPTQVVVTSYDDECSTVCEEAFTAHSDLGAPCPELVAPDRPFTFPQPSQPACPNCTLKKSDGTLKASVDESFDTVLHPILEAGVEVVGDTSEYFRLGAVTLDATNVAVIDLDETRFPANIQSATISILFDHPDYPRPLVNKLILE